MKKNENIPIKPRDAASVIIYKKQNKKYYVLMGKRSIKSKFMPSIYVFPGGAVDKVDYQVKNLFNLPININKNKIKTRSDNHTRAIMLAGIRETAEECNLFLAKKNTEYKKKSPILNNSWDKFLKNSLSPCFKNLFYFGRAITPTYLRIRFHARFFIANYENFIGKIKSNGELDDLGWIEIKKAKLLPIADVTEFLIDRLINLKENKKLFDKKKSYPMFTRKNNKEWVKWD